MEIKILHFYPDLMSLYGSYANVSILKRTLEEMGNTVTVERVELGGDADLTHADFVYMGAGTERAQKAALLYFSKLGDAVKAAADAGVTMLFAGNSMSCWARPSPMTPERCTKDWDWRTSLSSRTKSGSWRTFTATTDLYENAVVGFVNRCSVITGVETPLLTSMDMGHGNEGPCGPEGYHKGSVFASQLTGPILVKNPALLKIMVQAIYRHRGETCPEIPVDQYMAEGWAITAEQLKARCTK